MTLSPAADHEEPTPEERANIRHNCPHPDPEGEIATSINGALEVEAWCPDCKSAFYYYVKLSEMRPTDAHGWE